MKKKIYSEIQFTSSTPTTEIKVDENDMAQP